MTPVKRRSAVSTTPAKNLSPVSLTLAIKLCHGFLVIASVVDTGEQFFTGEQLSPVTMTPATNLLPVTRRSCGAAKDRRKLNNAVFV
jgi:hypothetical protein